MSGHLGNLRKENLMPHFLSFPNHPILPVKKVAQYSFWQNTSDKAFPGSVEVIKDGYILKCKKFNNVLYKTTTPHVYQNMNIVLWRNLGASWHLLGKKKHTRPCIKVGCLRPAATSCLLSFCPPKQTRVRFDSAIKSPVPQRDEEKGCRGRPPSPSSRSTSSGNEPPVKQKAEQSCTKAPPQRPLVPLVLMIQL